MIQSRWQSPVLWASIAGQILSIMLLTNAISVSDADMVNQIVAGVVQLLVTVGVLNNPTDKSGF